MREPKDELLDIADLRKALATASVAPEMRVLGLHRSFVGNCPPRWSPFLAALFQRRLWREIFDELQTRKPPLVQNCSYRPYWIFRCGGWLCLFVQPTLAGLMCPRCFGFEQLSGRVFVDDAMPQPLRAQLTRAMREGAIKVAAFYGELGAAPEVLACTTDSCWRRLGGSGAQGISYASVGIRLAARGIDPVIIAHELSHIELHKRLGLIKFMLGSIPARFDEGLAVIVSDDPRYLLASTENDRCRVEPNGDLPTSKMEWTRAAGTDHNLYARASCRVLRWMRANGGKAAALLLLQEVADGVPFSEIYHDPPSKKVFGSGPSA